MGKETISIYLWTLAPLILISVVFFIVAFRYFIAMNRSLRRLGGHQTKTGEIELEVDGRTVKLYRRGRRDYGDSEFSILVEGDFKAQAVFRLESKGEMYSRLSPDAGSDTPPLEPQIRFECADEKFAQQFLNAPEVRDNLQRMFLVFSRLEIVGQCISLVRTPDVDFSELKREETEEWARVLFMFADYVPRYTFDGGSATPLTDALVWREKVSLVVAGVMLLAGIVFFLWGGLYRPVYPWLFFGTSLIFSLPISVGIAWFTLKRFGVGKGREILFNKLGTALLICVVGLVLCGYGGVMLWNSSRDLSRPLAHTTGIIEKKILWLSKSPTYEFTVSGWGSHREPYTFSVDSREYEAFHLGDKCEMITRSGALGFEWFVSRTCRSVTGK